MFSKLLKYDKRAIFKYWWIAALSSVLAAVIGGVCIQIVDVEYTRYESLQVLASLGITFSVIALVILPVLTEILILVRFYKHFFTDEGYLTFTLPVKKTALLDSKLVSAFIFSVVTTVLFILDIFIMFAVGMPEELFNAEIWSGIGEFFGGFFRYFGGYGAAYIILGLLIIIVASVIQMLFIFICITIAAEIAKKHKVLTAIGIYYGASVALSMVMQVLSIAGVFIIPDLIAALESGPANLCAAIIMFGILGIFVAVGAALYMLELYLLDKKLNLE